MVDENIPEELRAAIELFYFAYRSFTSRPDKALEQRGLSRVHHRILYFVGRQPGQGVGALQQTLQISKQALNAPLRQLIEMKLIEASPASGDRRIKLLSLSDEGRALEHQLTATQAKQFTAAFGAAGEAGAEGWRQVMNRMAEAEQK
ncbi:MarR family winged helix-turn-helix transcriptional regulator [Niveibacterium terrae]|uniref:MarR family winged helix-turn-helix transcriptional regulator n=1 Tax=Niveibacterium terrae TaxID=3373598 RepID=UPI003A924395